MVLGRPALEFAGDLSRRGLRGFCEELNRLGVEEVRVILRHLLGTSEQEFPWDQLEQDRFLTNSWLHLVVRLVPWQSQDPEFPIPA